jgi:hypothetical protein
VLPGATLFHIAAAYLNDACQWSRLAAINNLADPFITSQQVLTVPDGSNPSRQANANVP